MCIGILLACMYMHHMHVWCLWETERVLDPQELELQMTVSCRCLSSENQTWDPWKSNQNCQPLSISSALTISRDDSPVDSRGTGWLFLPVVFLVLFGIGGGTGDRVRASHLLGGNLTTGLCSRPAAYILKYLYIFSLINSFF